MDCSLRRPLSAARAGDSVSVGVPVSRNVAASRFTFAPLHRARAR